MTDAALAMQVRQRTARLRHLLESPDHPFSRSFPWRTAADPYLRLVAEVLLQRTRAETVAKVWPDVVQHFPSASELAAASEERIACVIASLGLAHKRARYLKLLGEALVRSGGVPESVAELCRLPGVGDYSASALIISWKGDAAAPVDANVRRVLGRVTLGVDSADRRTATSLSRNLLSRGDRAAILFSLLDLGAAPCAPRRAMCSGCPAEAFCAFAQRASPLRRRV